MKNKLAKDRRAARLLESLDSSYFQFAESLPPPLNEIALQESTLIGHPGDETFKGPSKLNPLITCTPWLFWETFSELDDETLLGTAKAGAFIALASVVMDHLVDSQAHWPEAMTLFQHALYDRGIAELRALFPSTSGFWIQFDRLTKEYLSSLGAEIDAQLKPEQFSLENFLEFAGGKVSPMATTIAALAEASRQPAVLEPIETSFRHSFVAGQIHDDVLDWRLDVENRHLTFFLTRLSPLETWMKAEWPTIDELQTVNDAGWVDVDYFGVVIEQFDRSLEVVGGIQGSGWVDYLAEYRGVAEEHQKAAIARHLLRVLEPII
jgi:hypothetical protein